MSLPCSSRRDRRASASGSTIPRSLAAAAVAGVFVYCALSVLVGPAGLLAYRSLECRKAAMEANLERLASTNERLSGELEALVSDPERAASEARSLGYLRSGETAIVATGQGGWTSRIGIGSVLPYADPPALGDEEAKAIALGVSMALLAALLVRAGGEGRSRRRYRDRLVQSASLE